MNKSSKKIQRVAKAVEIPAPVLSHIKHLELAMKRYLRSNDFVGYDKVCRRLISYKKANNVPLS